MHVITELHHTNLHHTMLHFGLCMSIANIIGQLSMFAHAGNRVPCKRAPKPIWLSQPWTQILSWPKSPLQCNEKPFARYINGKSNSELATNLADTALSTL